MNTKTIIEENYTRDMEYLNTQLDKINDENVLSILIETITKLDSAHNNTSLEFEEMDVLEFMGIVSMGIIYDDEILTKNEILIRLKKHLKEWITISKQMSLENIKSN